MVTGTLLPGGLATPATVVFADRLEREPGLAGLTAMAYKSAARRQIVKQGYRIVLNVGDQWSDLQGIPEAEYSVKYPNPYYFIK